MQLDGAETPEQTFTNAARRAQIVAAAIRVLARNGFARASMASIAAECAGVSKGVLTYHFDSKADLMTEVVQSVLDDAARWMTPRVAGAASYREALHRYVSANVSFLDTHRDDIRALTEVLANARVTKGVSELFDPSQAAAREALEQLFAAGRATGEFGDVPVGVAAMALRATIDAASERLHGDPGFDLAAFERELLVLLDRLCADDCPPTGTVAAQRKSS